MGKEQRSYACAVKDGRTAFKMRSDSHVSNKGPRLGGYPTELSYTLRFWDRIFSEIPSPGGGLYLCVFSGRRPDECDPGKANKKRMQSVEEEFFRWPQQKEEAARHALNKCLEGHNVYHCGHLLTEPRRKKENAAPLASLYADDVPEEMPGGMPPPNVRVETSPGRFQGYWLLDRPLVPEEAEELNKRLSYAMGGADKTGWDLTQLLRPPPTLNYDYALVRDKPPLVQRCKGKLPDEPYDPERLKEVLLPLDLAGKDAGEEPDREIEPESGGSGFDPRPFLNDYQLGVYEGRDPVCRDGDVDRSGSLYKIAANLYEALKPRIQDDEILRSLVRGYVEERDRTLGWDTYTGRRDGDHQYWQIADKAWGEKHGGDPEDADDGADVLGFGGGRVMLGELIREGVKPPEELVEGVLLEGKVHAIHSGAGSGKSWVALGLALEVVGQGKPVIYLDKENGPKTMGERLESMGVGTEEIDELLFYYPYPSTPLNNESRKLYEEMLDSEQPALLVFDSWIGFLSDADLKENESSDIQGWANAYLLPARKRGVAVLILDHVPHDANRSRGSARKKEEVDVQWELHKSKDFDRETVGRVALKRTKDREGWLPEKVAFRVGGEDGGFVFERERLAGEDPGKKLTDKQRLVLTILKEKFDKGAIDSEWKQACEDYEDIGSSTFYGCKKKLIEGGFVGEKVEGRTKRFYPK